jgi:SAM-dependent methyltransferase
VRLTRAINRQAACPSGLFGRILGVIWPKEHGRLNAEVMDVLDVQAGQQVLEVGSGTGHALREVARRAHGGQALGLDASDLMVKLARARNRHAVDRGEVDVSLGEIEQWPLEVGSFDRIFAVHCIYFWRDSEGVLAKLGRALAPHGKLVLAFRPGGTDVPERFRDPTYRFPPARAVQESLQEVGLRTKLISSKAEPGVVILVAEKTG